jgi:glycosyltransferase involved in cell wall biosynthesis
VSPDVTVLLPVHNGERFVRRALDSILGQSFQDFEVVVVDDGSTDATASVLHEYADPRMRIVVHDQQCGLTASLNDGLAVARGALIARQDADDWSLPRRLERQVAFLHHLPDVAVVGTQAHVVDGGGRCTGRLERSLEHGSIVWSQLFDNAFIHTSVMARRDVLESSGGYEAAFALAEDFELWSRIAVERRVANLPEALVAFRRHADSATGRAGASERAQLENRWVIERNLHAVFGEPLLSSAEIDLLARFRQGPRAGEVEPFAQLLQRLLGQFLVRWPTARKSSDFWRTLARQHLTLARGLARGPGQATQTTVRASVAVVRSAASAAALPRALASVLIGRAITKLEHRTADC